MEHKFSKGKWNVANFDKEFDDSVYIQDESGEYVATAIIDNPFIDYNLAISKAKLIAAAPELFDRLNKLLLSVKAHPDYVNGEEGDEWHDIIDLAEQAIKKATE